MTKRRQRKGNSTLTEDQEFFLADGFCLDGFSPNFGHPRTGGPLPMDCPFETEEHMQAAWESIKDSIMAEAEAGTRPWAFYRFATEPRLRFPVLFGFGPAGWKHYPIETKGLFDSRPSEKEESESDYLDRTGQWADGEREAWENKK